MSGDDGIAAAAALDWAMRIEDPEFDDWDDHLAWLEEDPMHPLLYRDASIALSDGLARLQRLPAPAAANDDAPLLGRRWPNRAGWLVAAAAVAASAAVVLMPRAATIGPDTVFHSEPGRMRTVPLPDGTVLTLNGGTSIRLPASEGRRVVLERGEVFVHVAHDAGRPFRLVAADAVFQDVGTSFNARMDGGEVSLAVAEGVVAFDPDGADLRMSAGRSIRVTRRGAVIGWVAPERIGSWRSRRLTYSDAPLSRVAADISMVAGIRLILSDEAAARRFSGVLVLAGTQEEVVGRFATLADLRARRSGAAWRVTTP